MRDQRLGPKWTPFVCLLLLKVIFISFLFHGLNEYSFREIQHFCFSALSSICSIGSKLRLEVCGRRIYPFRHSCRHYLGTIRQQSKYRKKAQVGMRERLKKPERLDVCLTDGPGACGEALDKTVNESFVESFVESSTVLRAKR